MGAHRCPQPPRPAGADRRRPGPGRAGGGRAPVTTPDVAAAADLAAALPGVRLGERRPDRLTVHLDGTAPEALNRRLVDGGVRVRELVVERSTLEDVYLRLTGEADVVPG